MNRFLSLFSEGSHPKSEIIYYVMSVIFIVTAFFMGIIGNPPGIIMLLLGIFIMAFPFMKKRSEKKRNENNKNKKGR